MEDKINRYTMQFDKPQQDNEHRIQIDEKEAAFSKGQTLKLVNSESIDTRNAFKILVEKAKNLKGKAIVFHDHILISDLDANRKQCRKKILRSFCFLV